MNKEKLDPMNGKPVPAFDVGQRVRVRPKERNSDREGSIRQITWHHKDQLYLYYLDVDGKAVSERYCENELEPLADLGD